MDVNNYCDYQNMSSTQRSELANKIRLRRNLVALPESLFKLSIKAVFANRDLFFDQEQNPFRYLPCSVIQEFLALIAKERHPRGGLIPYALETQFVLKLLNPNVTQLDLGKFRQNIQSEYEIYRHLVENCPKIAKIIRTHKLIDLEPVFPMEDLRQWKNLKYIGLLNCMCTNLNLQQIQEEIPLLVGLEVSMETLTEKSVEHFSKMQHLQHLAIQPGTREKSVDTKLLVMCVGSVPKLKTFKLHNFGYDENEGDRFITLYGELFPKKKITIDFIRVRTPLVLWPACLHTNVLAIEEVENQDHQDALENLVSMPLLPREVRVNIDRSVVYPIINKIGKKIRVLTLSGPSFGTPASLYNIIEKCPNLEVLNYNKLVQAQFEDVYRPLPLSYFKNWKKFSMCDIGLLQDISKPDFEDNTITNFDRIFKMFLLGTENYNRKLEVLTLAQIKMLNEALVESPLCLNNLEEVCVNMYRTSIVEPALQMLQSLIFRSPYLKKIVACISSLDRVATHRVLTKDHKWFTQLTGEVGLHVKVVYTGSVLPESDIYLDYLPAKELPDEENEVVSV
ncbi:uncharacterized protein LOC132193149 [Neocloeon triangulifer]|uniref:uncharacterized protein LOC132193149 n=1 Tax=Neocloeon triangulifer TaxID=2078957 RepID=UPI00286F9CBB|nr:uncharacterized protein LOC132193149 [Neocloeon triangulifer]